jgi:cadmium resistance protein CadD (predicted permease)
MGNAITAVMIVLIATFGAIVIMTTMFLAEVTRSERMCHIEGGQFINSQCIPR